MKGQGEVCDLRGLGTLSPKLQLFHEEGAAYGYPDTVWGFYVGRKLWALLIEKKGKRKSWVAKVRKINKQIF